MLTRNDPSLAMPHVGGRLAVVVFIFTLLAFVVESQLTQYVQTNLHYRHPFFLFYLVHSTFSLIFPLHILYLTTTTQYSASSLLKGLSIAITHHLTPRDAPRPHRFPRAAFIKLVSLLTIGVTYPGLLWFAAVSLASVSDVTAIWNTNAFFAYIISVKLFKLKWEARKILAVSLATLGTVAVVYGGASSEESPTTLSSSPSSEPQSSPPTATFIKPTAPVLGNLLTLIASLGYGLYQVLYKIYAALPTDPEVTSDANYERIAQDEDSELDAEEAASLAAAASSSGASGDDAAKAAVAAGLYPPPFGLHPNLITSIIGLLTFLVLWIPLPFLHVTGLEPFALPPDFLTAISIFGIALGGMVFNAGFMILLGVWGPIITSVGNLLTIVLMLISDIIFGSGLESLTFWSLFGSGVIVVAFGILTYDMVSVQRG
ncbi:hypothetical protein H1R20_g15310, partial [Candolleomyces eurysporus]